MGRPVDVLASSRELFGADRCAVGLCKVLQSNGLQPTLVLPASRPERGLAGLALSSGIGVDESKMAIATSRGVEGAEALGLGRAGPPPEFTIFNSASVLRSSRPEGRRCLILREWLNDRSVRHRALCAWHRRGDPILIGVSHGVLEQWRMSVRGPRHQRVVWDWLEESSFQYSATGKVPRTGIICLGRFNQWKGQEVLAAAFERAFSSRTPRPTLTFVGYQPDTEFAQRSEAVRSRVAPLGGRVLPFLQDPSSALDESALLVLPSLHPEPFGLVLLEALRAGCKVIATCGGGPGDLQPLFPSTITVVEARVQAIAAALGDWWERGGLAQSEIELANTRRTLAEKFSPAAGREAWRAILG
jgi:glycosyltransferase involved in cell wall biosynthesis